ncbi:hypothetical protein CHS0354_000830 [Potamilus streckersoni]|uniref:Histidine kinase domain-containing protein n=1 Tax=Potamilus streckersoni TaxID=2493646 RepID=A0AAE0W9G7_9BIVA|nr:hypothetical protein CHS0354_000830 [Potamilus streckersoni]
MKRKYVNGLIFLVLTIGIVFFFDEVSDIINKIKQDQTKKLELWAKSVKAIIRSENSAEIAFIFDEIISGIDFPVILTTDKDEPITFKNIDLSGMKSFSDTTAQLKIRVADMKTKYSPVKIELESMVQYLYYDDSYYVVRLKQAPIAVVIFSILYVILIYWSLSTVRKSEQDRLWVGIAKETAHQLGTPLSALMGWVELLYNPLNELKPENKRMILDSMKLDIERLNIVSTRFSKIGTPERKTKENLYELIATALDYFKRRFSNTPNPISFRLEGSSSVFVMINKELFVWVIENLIKNAIDAMDKAEKQIEISVQASGRYAVLSVKDNGKGIVGRNKKKIFTAGFTTKKTGWGLGLALVKRIVELNHKGKAQP